MPPPFLMSLTVFRHALTGITKPVLVWLGLVQKLTWLGLGKDHILWVNTEP